MTVTASAIETTGFAARLWAGTKALHVQAERSGVIARILKGTATRDSYCQLLRNLVPAYLAMEQGLERHRDAPGVRLVALPETYRASFVIADLHAMAGEGWETRFAMLPAGIAYAEAITEAGRGSGERLIAHAYARYLGDLSGGQIMQRLLSQSLGLGPDQLAFYRFSQIADVAAFKDRYHRDLDTAGQEIGDPDAVLEEAALAFRLNIDVSEAVAGVA